MAEAATLNEVAQSAGPPPHPGRPVTRAGLSDETLDVPGEWHEHDDGVLWPDGRCDSCAGTEHQRDHFVLTRSDLAAIVAARTADLAAQVARVAEDARLVILSFREVEGNRQLYDAATHRCVDLLADSLAALSPTQPDTEPTA